MSESIKNSVRWVFVAIVVGSAWWFLRDKLGVDPFGRNQRQAVLRVLTYSSFTSTFGPGKPIADSFELMCNCIVKYINAADSRLMLERLKMGIEPPIDLVVGLDQLSLIEAEQNLKWLKVDPGQVDWNQVGEENLTDHFVPYDWSPMTLIYRAKDAAGVPVSWDDLKEKKFSKSLSLQDPLTSTPGLQFLMWMHSQKVSPQQISSAVHSISPSWSMAYGLFKSGQAAMTFSYLTSLVYHWEEEKDSSYQAVEFTGPYPYQVEYAAIPANCESCKQAEEFVQHMLWERSQRFIMKRNYMLPVVKNVVENTLFEKLPQLELISRRDKVSFLKEEKEVLQSWVNEFKKTTD